MHRSLDSGHFHFAYKEDHVTDTLLWERHCHAEFEMISVLEGDVSIVLEGRTYRLTENRTSIIPPLRYHTICANKQGPYRRVTTLFGTEAIPEVLRALFLQKDASLAILSSDLPKELCEILTGDAHAFYAPLAESLMIRLLYSNATTAKTSPPREIDETLGTILTYVDAHISEPITLDAIAAHTARSESSVSHLFREKMGVSPKQYILQKKLALADRLIRDGTPPTVAAIQIGYESYSNFYRLYKKHFRRSPSDTLREE